MCVIGQMYLKFKFFHIVAMFPLADLAVLGLQNIQFCHTRQSWATIGNRYWCYLAKSKDILEMSLNQQICLG